MREKSKIFGVNIRDILYGAIVAIVSSILTALHQLLSIEPLVISWITIKPIIYIGLTSGLAYIIKNAFSNSKGEFAKKETKVESLLGPGGSSNPPEGSTGLPK